MYFVDTNDFRSPVMAGSAKDLGLKVGALAYEAGVEFANVRRVDRKTAQVTPLADWTPRTIALFRSGIRQGHAGARAMDRLFLRDVVEQHGHGGL